LFLKPVIVSESYEVILATNSKMSTSFNNLRIGKSFRLVNFRETFEFKVVEIMDDGDCKLKDIDTLEIYYLYDLTGLGKGPDFDISEL